MLSMKI